MLPPFVKKFDFRGEYDKDIKNEDSYYLARAIQKVLPLKKVLLGWDTRPSSKNLAFHFINGLKDQEIEISYIDKCPIDYVTAGANAFDFDLSVMFTGSHNPQNWTGLLLHTKGGESVHGDLVTQIVNHFNEVFVQPYTYTDVDLSVFRNFKDSIEETYGNKLKELIPLEQIKPFTVLVDVGDGSGSMSLTLLEKLLPQVKFTRLNDRQLYDTYSPHVADPSVIENMQELIQGIKNNTYSCGFAFDSDADRILAVDEKGDYLNGSVLGSAMIEALVSLNTHDKLFGYAVDCGSSLHNTVTQLNKIYASKYSSEPIPVGRSIMRQMIRDGKIDFAVENVGHFYAKDFFMTDSGVYSLALILYWMSKNGPLSSLLQKNPDGERGQIFAPIAPDTGIQKQIEIALKDHFKQLEIKQIVVDGIRYEVFDGDVLYSWYAIRKSGYEQVEKYYFGSLDNANYNFLKATIQTALEKNSAAQNSA